MATNQCQDLEYLMQKPGFQNLVKGIQAQNIARLSLYDVIERKWKMFIARLPENEKEQLTTSVQCLKDKNIKCSKDQFPCCGHANCEVLVVRLTKLSNVKESQESRIYSKEEEKRDSETGNSVMEHENTGISEYSDLQSKVQGSYSDSCFCNYWELAKFFIEVPTDDSITLRDRLDTMSLIKLMKNCRLFELQDSGKIYSQVLEDTETLLYASDLHMSRDQLNKMLQNLKILLANWRESFASCLDAINDINQLELEAVECEQTEYKLLVKNVLEILDITLTSDKIEMDMYGNKSRLSEWSVSKTVISSLLIQANESISAYAPDETEELQTEITSLKEKMKNLEKERDVLQLENDDYCKDVEELKLENDALKKAKQEMENDCIRFKSMVDGDIDIKDTQYIAVIANTHEEFILLLELLLTALKERTTHEQELKIFTEPMHSEIIFNSIMPMSDAQVKIALLLEKMNRTLKDHHYIGKKVWDLADEARRGHVATFELIKTYVVTSSNVLTRMIPLIRTAFKLKKEVPLNTLFPKMSSLINEMMDEAYKMRDSFFKMIRTIQLAEALVRQEQYRAEEKQKLMTLNSEYVGKDKTIKKQTLAETVKEKDENETIGKDGTSTHGPNAVISMIDYAMNSYSTGETKCAIHADNCPGQNKNQYVIGYFMWRVMTGRHQEIEYHMQIPGHALCLVDSGFASLKKLYRRTDCDSLVQLQHVVDMSSATNEAVRYPAWQWRDWKSFLGPVIKPMCGIRKYQYFKMFSDKPGVVTVKENRDTDETTVNVLRSQDRVFPADDLPTVIPAYGLTRERQDYLYKAVRPYVRPMHQDSTCPAPSDQ